MSTEPRAGEAGRLAAEDAARANHYALIGRLFHAAPDSILLARLCGADAEPREDDTPLVRAWRALREACTAAFPVVVKQEYDTLFLGVGKSEVTPYTSNYVRGVSPDRHLVQLRERLERLGLGRCNAAFEVEDHVSGICDAMRALIEGDHGLAEQHRFFMEFVYPGMAPLCANVATATSSLFYRRVAEFTRAFLELEREAFEMHEADS